MEAGREGVHFHFRRPVTAPSKYLFSVAGLDGFGVAVAETHALEKSVVEKGSDTCWAFVLPAEPCLIWQL